VTRADYTIRQAIDIATTTLSGEMARLDAEILLSKVLNKPRSYLYAWPEQLLEEKPCQRFLDCIKRRARGEPIAYLTGQREFWSLDLRVSPEVLIPRPETELLVEMALERLPDADCRVADLGTGSGAIALALASERPNWDIIATDISSEALDIAQENARALRMKNLTFRISDWYEGLPNAEYQLLISNPPYVSNYDSHLKQGDVRFEPQSALKGGNDGLRDLRTLISGAAQYLLSDGWLMLEHGYNQAEDVRGLLYEAGFVSMETFRDLAQHPRVTIGRIGSKKNVRD
jgi:release factor glutamine methyltransferase